MLFIRHNRVKPPYHDYEALTVEQLDALATDKVAPDIAELPANMPFEPDVLKEARTFICSQSNRTQQTCMALKKKYDLGQPVQLDANLNELYFVPSQLGVESGESPLLAVRRRLYPAMGQGASCVEARDKVQARMDALFSAYAGQPVVLFSHGFFIRLLQSYAASKRDMAQALATIDAFAPVNYLELRSIS